MATDFKVLLKHKTSLGTTTIPYAVKVEKGSTHYTVSYYDDADHSGTLKTIQRPTRTFDVYATPKR